MEGKTFADYFIYSETSNKTFCLVENCGKSYSGYVISNLWRHLAAHHRSLHDELEPKRKKRRLVFDSDINASLEIRKGLVELCTVHGRPFCIVNDSGMKRILRAITGIQDEDIEDGRERCNQRPGFGFSRHQLKADIQFVYENMKTIITEEVKGKMLSMMVDIVSKRNKSILGIAVQFIKDDEITIRFLGMMRMMERHTGQYIADLVQEKLLEYGVAIEQIYTFTTDNGANVLKAAKILGSTLRDHPICEDSLNINEYDLDEWTSLFGEDEADNDNDDVTSDEMLDAFSQVFLANNERINFLYGMSCGAHTLQIEINNSIDN